MHLAGDEILTKWKCGPHVGQLSARPDEADLSEEVFLASVMSLFFDLPKESSLRRPLPFGGRVMSVSFLGESADHFAAHKDEDY